MTTPAGGRGRAQDQPALLLIGTGSRSYREYLLASISTGYRVHLLLGSEPTWEPAYVAGWSVLRDMGDLVDAAAMIGAAREVTARQALSGVLTWDEGRVLQAAKVADALGLPGGDPDAAMRCRDKHLTREALAAAGVPQAQSILVASVEAALGAARQIGYPVVLKPRALAASLGAVLVAGPEELTARFAFARDAMIPGAAAYGAGVLVEEYLTGPEISVDCAVRGGQVRPMFVARKQIGYPPYFEETGHVVDASDPLLADRDVLRVVQDAHTAIGLADGMTHAELKLTPAGPKVIEINGRLGGDLIPYIGMRASGIDPGLAAAAVACGQVPDLTARRDLIGAVRFFYVEHDDTRIESVSFDQACLPEAVDAAVPLAAPGKVVSPPPKGTFGGRIAYATAVAATARECHDALDAAQKALTVNAAAGD